MNSSGKTNRTWVSLKKKKEQHKQSFSPNVSRRMKKTIKYVTTLTLEMEAVREVGERRGKQRNSFESYASFA